MNRLYCHISNSTQKNCLTIDKWDVSYLGLSKFRTGANGKEQICYFNRNKKDKVYIKFLAVRKETFANEIIFSIEKLIDNLNNSENIYYEIEDELKEFDNDRNKLKWSVRGAGTDEVARTTTRTGQWRVSKKPRFLSG